MAAIGFIGLGMMGGAIMEALQARGTECVVFDVNPAAVAVAAGRGAEAAGSPLEVANRAETVVACLPSPAICRQVAYGENGVLTGSRIRRYVETSTLGRPAALEIGAKLAGRGIGFVDAPVSGGVTSAKEGKLTSMIAGDAQVLAQVRPLIESYSSRIFEVGSQPGAAQLAKLINNAIAIFGSLLTFEGLAVADLAGIDKAVLTDVINASSGVNFASQVMVPMGLLAAEPAPVGRAAIFAKDIQVYMQEIAALKADAPVAGFLSKLTDEVGRDPESDVIPALRKFFGEALAGAAATT